MRLGLIPTLWQHQLSAGWGALQLGIGGYNGQGAHPSGFWGLCWFSIGRMRI